MAIALGAKTVAIDIIKPPLDFGLPSAAVSCSIIRLNSVVRIQCFAAPEIAELEPRAPFAA